MTDLLEALSTAGWPHRLITLADWEDLPSDDRYRAEVSEGVVVVVPGASPRHGVLGVRLASLLDAALPPHLHFVSEAEVIVSADPLTIRIPDVSVVTSEAYASGVHRFAPADVALVVEIQSPGTVRTDRVTKASEYAEAGIPEYWLVDLVAGTLTRLLLDGPAYGPGRVHRGRFRLTVGGAELDLDLDALAR